MVLSFQMLEWLYIYSMCVYLCVYWMEKQRLELEGQIHEEILQILIIALFIFFSDTCGSSAYSLALRNVDIWEEQKCLFFRVKKKKKRNLSKYAFWSTWSWKSFAREMSFISSLWWNIPLSPDRHSSTLALHKLGGRVPLSYLTM